VVVRLWSMNDGTQKKRRRLLPSTQNSPIFCCFGVGVEQEKVMGVGSIRVGDPEWNFAILSRSTERRTVCARFDWLIYQQTLETIGLFAKVAHPTRTIATDILS